MGEAFLAIQTGFDYPMSVSPFTIRTDPPKPPDARDQHARTAGGEARRNKIYYAQFIRPTQVSLKEWCSFDLLFRTIHHATSMTALSISAQMPVSFESCLLAIGNPAGAHLLRYARGRDFIIAAPQPTRCRRRSRHGLCSCY